MGGMDSFDDVIAMDNLKSKVEGAGGNVYSHGNGELESGGERTNGIMFSTTVEITRKPRGDESG